MTKSTSCTFALAAPLSFCLSYPSAAQENALEAKHVADIDIWLNGGQFTDDLTSAYIENHLNESSVIMTGCTNSLYYGLGYSLGYFAVEALSAIKGVESSMALLERLGLGQDFELAFKDVYDIEWDAAVPILARVIEITAADSPR
tara:strand:+ start:492 stop:926 length:435 start_codon:yes stop_codon:yes gene_type:complete